MLWWSCVAFRQVCDELDEEGAVLRESFVVSKVAVRDGTTVNGSGSDRGTSAIIRPIELARFRLVGGPRSARKCHPARHCTVPQYHWAQIALAVYLLPALLAVLITSGLGVLILAVAARFSGPTRRPRGTIVGDPFEFRTCQVFNRAVG